MLALVTAVSFAIAHATPPPQPPAVVTASAAIVRAVDDVDRRTPAKDTAAKENIARLKKLAKDPLSTPLALFGAADEVASLAPDVENVHVAALDAMLALAPLERDPRPLHARIRTRAVEFVQRNATSTAGYTMLATALAALGDEEGQLRALFTCGDKCRPAFLVAATKWQRVRCTGDGIARGLELRVGAEVIARAHEVSFLEPIAAVPGVAATYNQPAVPEVPAQCLVQLVPSVAARVPPPAIAGPPPAGLFVLNGISLVSDTLRPGSVPGSVIGPAVVCERLCKKAAPRALPAGITTAPPAPLSTTTSTTKVSAPPPPPKTNP